MPKRMHLKIKKKSFSTQASADVPMFLWVLHLSDVDQKQPGLVHTAIFRLRTCVVPCYLRQHNRIHLRKKKQVRWSQHHSFSVSTAQSQQAGLQTFETQTHSKKRSQKAAFASREVNGCRGSLVRLAGCIEHDWNVQFAQTFDRQLYI